MFVNTVSSQFIAALGLNRVFDKYVELRMQRFCHKTLLEYRREVQDERGRQLMAQPMNYGAVRALDREMEEVSQRLRALEMEQSFK